MRTFRIIPRLEIKGPNLVKGVHLEGLRVLGKPEEFAYRYYQDGADELIYMDVVASLYGRNSLLDFVSRTAEKIFIPLTVGGGIRSIEDIRSVLRAGADKVAINTAAINNPGLISEAAEVFGSQCIVISIEAKRKPDGRYEAYTDNGREKTGVDVYEWAKKAAGLGAGELLVTSIDREGTGKGFDTELIREVSTSVAIPVIACGGAGSKGHFADAVKDGRADALCASSVFHYNRLRDILEEDKFKEEGNIEYLKKFSRTKQPFEVTKHDLFNIKALKQYLAGETIACRL